jgi:hypothetical protein
VEEEEKRRRGRRGGRWEARLIRGPSASGHVISSKKSPL